MTPSISVILCAHNPRPAHFQATLDGLRAQDLPLSDWELLIIDNQSDEPLASRFDISWHPRGRIIVETTLGLAHARRRGYQESVGALVIHSDDDNILDPAYLRNAWHVHQTFPQMGTYGGNVIARYDVPPPDGFEAFSGNTRLVDADRWSNTIDDPRTMPIGAGMCLRREVIRAYLEQVERDPRRLILGRTGNRFITGEDIDLNYVAVRLGYGTGLFRALSLIHLIPENRGSFAHITRYSAGNAYSMVILHYFHFGTKPPAAEGFFATLRVWLRLWLRMSARDRQYECALRRARREARRDMVTWGWIKPSD